jgi:cell division protein ZapA (FtsZ GTPase activity inhibitor)
MKSARRPVARHSVTVEIAGEKHVLRSELPPEDTRAIAAHVDTTLRGLPGYQTLEPFRAATLAALSITDELFHARESCADCAKRSPGAPPSSPPSWKRRARRRGEAAPPAPAAGVSGIIRFHDGLRSKLGAHLS